MTARLTRRELQVAEFVAWGASLKEVPSLLSEKYGDREISVFTVQNTLKKIYVKTGTNRINELSAWWFTHKHGVDAGLAPSPSIKKRLLALLFLVMITPQIISTDLDQALRPSRSQGVARTTRVERCRRRDDI